MEYKNPNSPYPIISPTLGSHQAPRTLTATPLSPQISNFPKMTKLCIIFPNLDSRTPTHFYYWQQLFQKIKTQKLLHLRLIDETTSPLPLRFFKILQARLQGYSQFYVHYSFSSLISSWFITRPLGGTTYFWHCEKYSEFHFPLHPTPQGLWQKLWQDWLFRLCLHLTDHLVTGHQKVAKSYTQILHVPQAKIAIVPNYVTPIKILQASIPLEKTETTHHPHPERNQRKPPPSTIKKPPKKLSPQRKIHILFVHHLSPRKGSRELPQIINSTLSKIPSAHFHLIGSGPDQNWLSKNTSTKNSTLYGSLPLPQVISFYKSADYLILPSRSEGFPRVILEAMFYKIPFVSTDVGCIKQIVSPSQYQFLTPPQHPQLFTQKLIELINLSPSKKQILVESNYHQSLKYNQQATLQAFIHLFTPKSSDHSFAL